MQALSTLGKSLKVLWVSQEDILNAFLICSLQCIICIVVFALITGRHIPLLFSQQSRGESLHMREQNHTCRIQI